jgi:hypothetical protein
LRVAELQGDWKARGGNRICHNLDTIPAFDWRKAYSRPSISRMPSSGMWHRVAVRIDVSEKRKDSIIRVKESAR